MSARQDMLAALLARPIAHRGLHEAAAGIIENSRSAVAAAVRAGFGVEVDVRLTADDRVVVFHDGKLDRMTAARGALIAHTATELTAMPLLGSAAGDRIWTIEDLLAEIGGRVPLVIEMKTEGGNGARLAGLAAGALAGYGGPVGLKSFDPSAIHALRRQAPHIVRGIIGCAFVAADWPGMGATRRATLRHLLHWPATRPHFLSWDIADLPRPDVSLARFSGVPVMTWTVTSAAMAARARTVADQIVFQDFVPSGSEP
jgi:glycerophosphoryl diester phosphodiesterase